MQLEMTGKRHNEDKAEKPAFRKRFWDRFRFVRYHLKSADPVKRLALPEEHRGHTDAQWEWWYFNGHLETASGRKQIGRAHV